MVIVSSSICIRMANILPAFFGVAGGVFEIEDVPLPSTPAGVDCACANLLNDDPDDNVPSMICVYVAGAISCVLLL